MTAKKILHRKYNKSTASLAKCLRDAAKSVLDGMAMITPIDKGDDWVRAEVMCLGGPWLVVEIAVDANAMCRRQCAARDRLAMAKQEYDAAKKAAREVGVDQ